MSEPTIAPYGTWSSPLAAEDLTRAAVRLSEPGIDATGAWWVEQRPEDGGRSTLVFCPFAGEPHDVSPTLPDGTKPDIGSRVHEYGGLSYTVSDDLIVFSERVHNRVYSLTQSRELTLLTPPGNTRFGDFELDRPRGVVYAVREDHGDQEFTTTPVNELVAIPLDGSGVENPAAIRTLVTGHDFVTSPRLAPDGADLAWVTWELPQMPWTSAKVRVAPLAADGTLGRMQVIAGGDGVAASQPMWARSADLIHIDDSSGFGNLYRTEGFPGPASERGELRTRDLHPADLDFSWPQWGLGPRTLAAWDDDRLAVVYHEQGRGRLAAVTVANGELETFESEWEPAGPIAAADGRVVMLAATATTPASIVLIESGGTRVLRQSAPSLLDPMDVSVAQALTWPSDDGVAHGFYYPPTNSRYQAPADELPPLIVFSHGGPTSATSATFSPKFQFWTTRGFAVLDVNYGGSTGYGRAYQDRLDGAWGIVDMADCAAGALYLAERGLADPDRLGIEGGSAGGYTTLAALTFTDVFTAGASRYGIGDLAALAADTHKFESRYLDLLIGPYPEAEATYRERSPIHHTDQLSVPMILLQGTEDRVVPPAQSEAMADALAAKGIPHALVMFDGEGHGFRRADTQQATVNAELSFFAQVWGFEPAGDVPKLELT